MQYKFHLLSTLCVLYSFQIFAQSNTNQSSTNLEGKVVLKPWTKTEQSYCARGSDYFVLLLNNGEEIVLEAGSKKINLLGFLDEEVKLEGNYETKTIKSSGNSKNQEIEQRPITFNPDGTESNQDYQCTVFKVNKIALR